MRYLLIKETSLELFNENINDRLEDGWLLHGQTFIYKIEDKVFYTQAVIKNEQVEYKTPIVNTVEIVASWNC